MRRPSAFRNPIALVVQGFIAASFVFVAVDPTVVGAGAPGEDVQATARLAELTR